MKNLLPTLLSLSIIITLLFSACDSSINSKDYQLVEVTSGEIDSAYMDIDSIPNSLLGTISKGETWKMWQNLHKECLKSEWLKRPFYFGVTNTLALGTVTDKKYKAVYIRLVTMFKK